MTTRFLIAATVAAFAVGAVPAMAQTGAGAKPAAKVGAAKEKSIRELLDLMGVEKLSRQMTGQMFDAYRKQMPQVPADVWKKMEAKLSDVSEVIDNAVQVYDKHYTQADINGLIAFYKSPLGQKYLQELPAVQRESALFGAEWGRRKGAELQTELQAAQAAKPDAPKER